MNQGYDRDEPGELESDGKLHPILIHARKALRSSRGSPPCSRLVGCGVAIYLLVMAFTEDGGGGDSKGDKKNRSRAVHEAKAGCQRDQLHRCHRRHPVGDRPGDRRARAARSSVSIRSSTPRALNAGQVLTLR